MFDHIHPPELQVGDRRAYPWLQRERNRGIGQTEVTGEYSADLGFKASPLYSLTSTFNCSENENYRIIFAGEGKKSAWRGCSHISDKLQLGDPVTYINDFLLDTVDNYCMTVCAASSVFSHRLSVLISQKEDSNMAQAEKQATGHHLQQLPCPLPWDLAWVGPKRN